jgi:hypothetical protein
MVRISPSILKTTEATFVIFKQIKEIKYDMEGTLYSISFEKIAT